MKRFFTILSFAVLCLTGCECPDCGNTVSLANVNTIFVTKTPGGDFILDNEQIILKSSCDWTATNLTPQYLDFANTNGTGGVHYLPVGLTPEFLAAIAADVNNFPEDATGDRKIGTIHFDSSCEGGFDVNIYLQGLMALSFNINGGEGMAPKPVGFISGEEVTIPENTTGMTFSTPAKEFVGWGTEPDGSGVFCKDGSTASFTDNTTLYAMWSGDGSSADARMHIYNRRTLDHVRTTIGDGFLYYLVVADFNANYDEVDDQTSDSWVRIGGGGSEGSFIGDFDGNGHTIEYYVTEIPAGVQRVGLFGETDNSATIIKDLHVFGSIEGAGTSHIYAGGIVGVIRAGELTRCTADVSINVSTSSNNNNVGGIAGYNNENATISHCLATASVSGTCSAGTAYVGGISGYSLGTISQCVVMGAVNGRGTSYSYSVHAGGIVGSSQECSINQCVVLGAVSGVGGNRTRVGGIVGSSNACDIYQCVATGAIYCESLYAGATAGGIIGSMHSSGGSATYCVALNNGNPAIFTKTLSADTDFQYNRRIMGTTSVAPANNNYGLYQMFSKQEETLGGTTTTYIIATSSTATSNGADVTLAESKDQSWWTSTVLWSVADWDFSTLSTLGVPWPINTPKAQP